MKSEQDNPLTPTAIQKLLEIIDIVRLYPSCSFATALDSDINRLPLVRRCEKIDVCMPQCVCCVQASREAPATRRNWVNFIGQFSWVTGDPIGVKGLINKLKRLQLRV